ncbi:MAG: hypothetical protein HOD43_10185 [Candidatus Marinimicrobia bacterium]|jgi:hypothetical protein|nr:hypothetical protein [Candidatus Neomarinimicrobiota bacterium]MBT3631258.1 hypothetical protein [Candidatus Neomarinimicrobiota bacterium]MBT3824766.1 hypothetical protein [Candidatus Neomarinimicrobiota bacterium]MBT4132044.1 hypothetical protein [Candidatus Neomarinimicrobiota bacterium]MBT4296159.1 hypothetical protein [Candidatus Neomarinimicrobiota bacterium]
MNSGKTGASRWLRLALFVFLFCCFSAEKLQSQTPLFLGEDLVFYVSDSLCVLRGEYHFLNPGMTPLKTRLFYPFPISEDLPFPDKVEVRSMESGVHLPLLGGDGGVSFVLEMDSLAQSSIHVEYWQTAESHIFEYILTTTQAWSRALEWANYEIHVPEHLELEYCSLDLDTSWVEIEKRVYSIYRENYLPVKNFEIRWGNKE